MHCKLLKRKVLFAGVPRGSVTETGLGSGVETNLRSPTKGTKNRKMILCTYIWHSLKRYVTNAKCAISVTSCKK